MMPKFLENEENIDELARRLIAELAATRQKQNDNKSLAEYGRNTTAKQSSVFNTPRLTQHSTA